MRVVSCLFTEHNIWLVLVAAMMCVTGAAVTMRLFRRALRTSGTPRHGWHFLIAVCAGSSIWSTHFIAMLGYRPAAPVTFDPVLTILSLLIAMAGTGAGFAIAGGAPRKTASLAGGGLIGLAISAMHYTGMFAYRVDGPVAWIQPYVLASIALAVVFAAAAAAAARRWEGDARRHGATALLVVAIVSLHFTAMAAFEVTPMPGIEVGADSAAFRAMALSDRDRRPHRHRHGGLELLDRQPDARRLRTSSSAIWRCTIR